jgi:tRNA pseudouridine32 synthase/23S rRNA pseudouridine746 synthase
VALENDVKPVCSTESVLASVLYRDDHSIILNKPTGIAVHRTPKGDENLESYFSALTFERSNPPMLAHRLDKLTSGCLVLGRHAKSIAHLGKLFTQGRIKKRYVALVLGHPPEASGTFSRSILRVDLGRGKWEFRCSPEGQEAITEYRLLAKSPTHSLLSLSPLTGRTHQLRLHCQALGCPIVGDVFYGGGEGQLLLHAFQVHIPSATGYAQIDVTAPLPDYFDAALEAQGLAPPAPQRLGSLSMTS